VTTRETIGVGMLGYAFMGKAHTRIAGEGTVGPRGATFEDGYRCAEVCDAIVRSAESGKREEITYRGVEG
jgi:hypothetical protein